MFNKITTFLSLGAFLAAAPSYSSPQDLALRLFDRLAGIPLSLSDPRYNQMVSNIQQSNFLEAASIAAKDDNFSNITLKHFFSALSNRDETPLVPLNDFIATGIGIVRDDLDARLLLSSNFIYKADTTINDPGAGTDPKKDIQTPNAIYVTNMHYQYLEDHNVNLATSLVQAPQYAYTDPKATAPPSPLTDAAGLLTTRGWAEAHLFMGTNRRAIEFAFQEFLCLMMPAWSDTSAPENLIRRDVDRNPGGNVLTFINTCRGCHGGMDALGGAYAYYDFPKNGPLIYTPGTVQKKMLKNESVYPAGHVTLDDSWVNYSTKNQNTKIGWTGKLTGNGVQSFGTLLANTKQFSSCMAQRIFTEVCRRDPAGSDLLDLDHIAAEFQLTGYNMRQLFKKIAILPECLGR